MTTSDRDIKAGDRVRIKAIPGDTRSTAIAAVHGQAGVVVAVGDRLVRVRLDSGDEMIIMHQETEPA
jgi:ribosomal protein L21E